MLPPEDVCLNNSSLRSAVFYLNLQFDQVYPSSSELKILASSSCRFDKSSRSVFSLYTIRKRNTNSISFMRSGTPSKRLYEYFSTYTRFSLRCCSSIQYQFSKNQTFRCQASSFLFITAYFFSCLRTFV